MKISILFVEDEPSIREELASFLKRFAGKNLYIASNGEEGLTLYLKYKPDLVISDIRMPKMNGLEMVTEIKNIDPNQAVIFTTAHSDSNFFIDAIELQVEGYLLKPVDLKLLDKKIKSVSDNILIKKRYTEQQLIMNEIAHLQGNLMAVLNEDNKPLFLNKKWMKLLNIDTLEALDDKGCLSQYFQKKEGYFYPTSDNHCYWVDELLELESDQRIVAMKLSKEEETRAYIVSLTYIQVTKHLIISFAEITHIEKEKYTYQKQAHTDLLTQLYNRAKFNLELDRAIDECRESGETLSMILLDLDYFKKINDAYGHLVGDKVLISLSAHMKSLIRSHDILARWGGEEFVILLQNTDIKGATILAEKMRSSIESYIFSHDIRLTCSFGVVSMVESDLSATALFSRADKALYQAKQKGRNSVVIAQ